MKFLRAKKRIGIGIRLAIMVAGEGKNEAVPAPRQSWRPHARACFFAEHPRSALAGCFWRLSYAMICGKAPFFIK